ncbi:MAG: hypothetical protein J0G32_00220, partial [Alphaproteobacteria bacterium]|nr:hypothetical protein [Alphaproteobacteria bacterium]
SNGNIAGITRPAGAVTTANSLSGAVPTNEIGFTVTALSHADGHYIVRSQNWEDSAVDDNRGAVTWVDGRNGHIAGSSSPGGAVTMANSLYGDADSLFLGSSVTTLTNGNYVVHTSNWNGNRGAAVWVDGNNGNIADTGSPGGVISAANSLSGGSVGDRVGSGVQALTNGHYVVRSSGWNSSAGAVTWVDGTNGHIAGSTAVSGNVSAANSIYNSGSGSLNQSVIPLTNGNYVVRMSGWSGFVGSGGSATWVDGNNGNIAGTSSPGGDISTTNSLYGSQAVDSVAGTGIQALSNGNYVVISSNWGNGGTSNVGAVTWVDGTNGHIAGTSSPGGAVSTSNSLYGGAASDAIGASGVVPLNNGNYFVLTPMWNNGATTGAGAVTWVNGSNGYIAGSSSPGGALSTSNSLYGSSANDQIGLKFGTGTTYLALSTGNYLVLSPDWDNGATAAAGAVTWVNGSDGNIVGTSSAGGAVTIYNSLVTNTASSGLLSAIEDTVNNTYVVGFPSDSGRGRVYVLPVSGELLNDGNDVTFDYVSR